MIDEKKIQEAAASMFNAGSSMNIAEQMAFERGVYWFKKALWHSAEEEPKEKDKLLMVEVGKNKKEYVHFKRNQGCLFGGWKHYVNMVDVNRWLYMDDLF